MLSITNEGQKNRLVELREETQTQQEVVDEIIAGLRGLVVEKKMSMYRSRLASMWSGTGECPRTIILGEASTTAPTNDITLSHDLCSHASSIRLLMNHERIIPATKPPKIFRECPGCQWLWSSALVHSPVGKFVASRTFEITISLVISCNSLFVGYTIDYARKHVSEQSTDFIEGVEVAFFTIYTLELVLRLFVFRLGFFFNSEWRWNWFDSLLIVVSTYDYLAGSSSPVGGNIMILRTFKMLRLAKMLRMIRLMRNFRELRLMLSSIVGSMRTFFWSVAMIGVFIYIFALCFIQGSASYLSDISPDTNLSHVDDILQFFGGLKVAMESLLMAVTGGYDWELLAESLEHVGSLYYFLFLVYVVFLVVVVLNILTGLFVDTALQVSTTDQKAVLQEKAGKQVAYIRHITQIFHDRASDASASLTWREFQPLLRDKQVLKCLSEIELEPEAVPEIFHGLSGSEAQKVSADQFIDGCLKARGLARRMDMYDLVVTMRRTLHMLKELMYLVEDNFDHLQHYFTRMGAGPSTVESLRSRLTRCRGGSVLLQNRSDSWAHM